METRPRDECNDRQSTVSVGTYCQSAGCHQWICIECRRDPVKKDLCPYCFTVPCDRSENDPHQVPLALMRDTIIGKMCFECYDLMVTRAQEQLPLVSPMISHCPYCNCLSLRRGEVMCAYCRENTRVVFGLTVDPVGERKMATAVIWMRKSTSANVRDLLMREGDEQLERLQSMYHFLSEHRRSGGGEVDALWSQWKVFVAKTTVVNDAMWRELFTDVFNYINE